jgi:hypothetical protein
VEALGDAVAAVPMAGRRSATDVVSDAVARAEEVTAGVERASDLVAALAKGMTLDPKVLEKEANALLDLLDRADREGRWEDERRLARALVALLALVPRWVALIEVLRRTASAAAAVGDRATEAWAHHEIGSFALVADNLGIARQHLTQALELRNSLADGAGADVTLHNMRMLAPAQPVFSRQTHRLRRSIARHPLISGIAAFAVLATAGGLAGAGRLDWSRSGEVNMKPPEKIMSETDTAPDDPDATTTRGRDTTTQASGTTAPESDTTTQASGTTTPESDTVDPIARMMPPGRFVREVITLSAFARDAGGSGLDAVVFELARPGTDAWQRLGRDTDEPYSLGWDTRMLDDGRYDLRVTALDEAGNQQVSAPAKTLVDNTPPVIYLGFVPNPASGTITVSAKAIDGDGSGVRLVVFELSRHDVDLGWGPWEEVGRATQGWPFEVTIDTTTKRDGPYHLRATAFDRAGYKSVSEPEDITIDQPDPTGGVE